MVQNFAHQVRPLLSLKMLKNTGFSLQVFSCLMLFVIFTLIAVHQEKRPFCAAPALAGPRSATCTEGEVEESPDQNCFFLKFPTKTSHIFCNKMLEELKV